MNNKANKAPLIICLVLSFLYISLAISTPISINAAASHDDAWFVRSAESILHGKWLGNFNEMTLIKGMGYPYILVINSLIGIPITLTLSILYLASCAAFAFSLRKCGLQKFAAIVLFALLLFQPVLFPTRIIRDNIYTTLLLFSTSGLILIALHEVDRHRNAILGVSGISLGMLFITREEGIWVVPAIIFLTIYSLFASWRNGKSILGFSKSVGIFIAFLSVPPLTTASINWYVYGVFQDVDIKNKSYVSALNSLYKVRVGNEIQFIPVHEKKRDAIYRISPAFKELQPFFEDIGKHWTVHGCAVYKHTCGDYAGGWFMWAFRKGVSSLGYYETPASAAQYYDRIVNEIEIACDEGKIDCEFNTLPFVPSITPEAIKSIPKKLLGAINLTIYKAPGFMSAGESWGPIERINEIRTFLGNPSIYPSKEIPENTITGWYYASNDKWISLICSSDPGTERITPIKKIPSPDVVRKFNDSRAALRRFSIYLVESSNCHISSTESDKFTLPMREPSQNGARAFDFGSGRIQFDDKKPLEPSASAGLAIKIINILNSGFQFVSGYLFAAGTASILAAILHSLRKRTLPNNLGVISIFLWTLYYTRIALMTLIDVTSFPAINTLYLAPAFVLWISASVCGIFSLFNSIWLPANARLKISRKPC
ncbi:hypothetical protein [Hydrogenophaga sp. PAMC20947]|uniref:hypothetical protein n=1 Tax=Hydrogenophaga sp. PAMC20947 TaxID=2565558 RepID=UPI00109E220A|nr:hypothetical protein [Hydrogenophaga sp. PAMC20947]QCB46340.1 hypothetical protein E5678_10085 [Hydrogenophaga sp. PAMC20947]